MPTKGVVDRQKLATAVIAAATTHASLIGVKLKEALGPALAPGQSPPDGEALALLAAHRLAQVCTEMVKADEAHQRELADDDGPRARRDALAAALREVMIDLRDVLLAAYGPGPTERLGLSGETPRDATQLLRFAGDFLVSAKLITLPPPLRRRSSVVLGDWLSEIQDLHGRLDEALTQVAREGREAEGTLVRKDTAMAGFDRHYGDTANLVSALLLLAGEAELARRVRPRQPAYSSATTEEVAAAVPVASPETAGATATAG